MSQESSQKTDSFKYESDERRQRHAQTMATLEAKINQVGELYTNLEAELRSSVTKIVEEFKKFAERQKGDHT